MTRREKLVARMHICLGIALVFIIYGLVATGVDMWDGRHYNECIDSLPGFEFSQDEKCEHAS